jgi:hypothetical protein
MGLPETTPAKPEQANGSTGFRPLDYGDPIPLLVLDAGTKLVHCIWLHYLSRIHRSLASGIHGFCAGYQTQHPPPQHSDIAVFSIDTLT